MRPFGTRGNAWHRKRHRYYPNNEREQNQGGEDSHSNFNIDAVRYALATAIGGKAKGQCAVTALDHRPAETLEAHKVGLFCSVRCPGDAILGAYDAARKLRDEGVTK